MDNIEKFNKIKELNKLKSELHKREFARHLSFNSGASAPTNKIDGFIRLGKKGIDIYSIITSLFNQNEHDQ